MNFYRIFYSLIENEIGYFPQVYSGIVEGRINDTNQLAQIDLAEAGDDVIISKGILSVKAKKTDLVSASFMDLSGKLYVSEKLNNILVKATSAGVQHLKTALIYGKSKKEEVYWIINPYLHNYSFLDFEKSKFCYQEIMSKKIVSVISFSNHNEFEKEYLKDRKARIEIGYPEHNTALMINHIVVDDKLVPHFFSLTPVSESGIGFYVSEKIKLDIEAAGCTGIVFKELNEGFY